MKRSILLTGGSDGIGKAASYELAALGHKLVVLCRDQDKCKRVVKDIISTTGNNEVYYVIADLSSQNQIRRVVEEIKEKHPDINVIVNNAGVFMHDRVLTEDGIEITFAVNHLAPFMLTLLLIEMLIKNAPSRVVVVSSMAHSSTLDINNLQLKGNYDPYRAYSMSKLCNILFTFELARRLKGKGVSANCLHPGVINTKLLIAGWGAVGSDVSEGAKRIVHLAVSDEVEGITGKYFFDMQIATPHKIAYDEAIARRLWEISEGLCNIKSPV